jgi:hypothetical protein
MPPQLEWEVSETAERGHDGKNFGELTAERAVLWALNHASPALAGIVTPPIGRGQQ